MALNSSSASASEKHRGNRRTDADLHFLPPRLGERLMPFQREGVRYALSKDGRVLIADEMGLGKTLQALSVAYYYKYDWPLLIIVPSSLRYPWIEELEKWMPEIHPHDINLIQGGADIGDISKASITIVTYGLLRHPGCHLVREALHSQHFKVVIADESHYLKNRKSATSKYLVPLIKRADRKILLTGTPALARPEELYPQLDALGPGDFGNWSNFSKRYCDAHYQHFGRQKRWVTNGASNLEELQYLLTKMLMIRRLKKDVLTQLPAKQRQKIPFDLKDSDVKKTMDQTWDEMLKLLDKNKMNISQAMSGAGALHSADVDTGGSGGFEALRLMGELHTKTCAVKLGPVKDYVKMLCQNAGLKMLIFAYHHVMMNSIMEQLMEDHVKYIRIDGNTIPQDRPRLVHQFQIDPETRVAILSIKAAGVGITLTAAKLVVFAELDWTPGTLEQCEDRAHRIGQKDTVHVHYLVAKGTLDDWVWSALSRKTAVVTTTLNGERQVLRMSDPNRGQVDCLSNADAYVPSQSQQPAENLAQFFQSQSLQASGQKTLLEYFTPKSKKSKKRNAVTDAEASPVLHHSTSTDVKNQDPESSKDTTSSKDTDLVVLLDSEDDEDAFRTPQRKKKISRSTAKTLKRHHWTERTESPKSRETSEEPESEPLKTPSNRSKFVKESSAVDADELPELISTRKRRRQREHTNPQSGVEPPTAEPCTDSEPSSRATDKWSCSMCTFLNHIALPFCEMCTSPRAVAGSKKRRDEPAGSKAEQTELRDSLVETPTRKRFKLGSIPSTSSPHSSSDHPKFSGVGSKLLLSTQDPSDGGSTSSTSCCDIREVCAMDTEDKLCIPDSDASFDDGVMSSSGCNEAEPDISWSESPSGGSVVEYDIDTETLSESHSLDLDPDLETAGTHDSDLETIEPCDSDRDISEVEAALNCLDETDALTPTKQSPTSGLDPDVISKETAAAKQLFGATAPSFSGIPWVCAQCETYNEAESQDCEGCLESRPQEEVRKAQEESSRVVNLDKVPTYDLLQYCCSKNTSRIYLYDKDGENLDVNFTPLDIQLDNYGDLPDLLLHPHNLRLVHRFVREWNSLAPTKRRLIIKSGQVFISPFLLYDELKSGKKGSRQRYITKTDVAAAALSKAEEIGGSVRVITRPPMLSKGKKRQQQQQQQLQQSPLQKTASATSETGDLPGKMLEKMKGIVQAMDASGQPLCVYCHKVYNNQLITQKTVKRNPWQTRFCSRDCMQQYWVRSHRDVATREVYEAEHGVCQLCELDAQEFFLRIRNTTCEKRRALLIQQSTYSTLKSTTKERMVKQPNKGLFWHVDHIKPVSQGGGECDVDNLRTLCIVCHMKVTAQQNKDRAGQRRLKDAAQSRDITAFFQPM